MPARPTLHRITGWVKHIPADHFDANPSYYDFIKTDVPPTFYHNLPHVPNASVHLLGNNTLHDDPNTPGAGSLYYVTPAGAGPIDCTPTVYGDNFYTWGFSDFPDDGNDTPSFSDAQYVPMHLTEHPALTDTNRERLNLGVGEEVGFSGMPANTSWSVSAGGIVTNQYGVIVFTAPSNAVPKATVTGKVNVDYDVKWLTDFAVFEPSGYDHAAIVSTACNPMLWPSTGASGVGMQLNVYMGPTNVSFYRVQILEIPEDATNIWGYFTNTYLWTTDPASALHHYPSSWFGLNDDNSWSGLGDVCYNPGGMGNFYSQLPSGGWSSGSFTWIIPAAWRVEGTSGSNSMTGWNQVFTIEPNGTATITKFNKTVIRTINNVITPCL